MSDVRSDWILYKNDIRLIIIYQFNSLLKEEENKICNKLVNSDSYLEHNKLIGHANECP